MEDCIELFRITKLQDAELRAPVDDLQSSNVDFVRSSQVVSVIHGLKREIAGIIEAFRWTKHQRWELQWMKRYSQAYHRRCCPKSATYLTEAIAMPFLRCTTVLSSLFQGQYSPCWPHRTDPSCFENAADQLTSSKKWSSEAWCTIMNSWLCRSVHSMNQSSRQGNNRKIEAEWRQISKIRRSSEWTLLPTLSCSHDSYFFLLH